VHHPADGADLGPRLQPPDHALRRGLDEHDASRRGNCFAITCCTTSGDIGFVVMAFPPCRPQLGER